MPAGFKLAYITTCTWFSWCQALPQESVICKDGLCKEEDSTLSMLQTVKVGYDGATEAITLTNQNSELQKALPFAWFHLPKCGSSLGNLIIHTPGVCKDLSKDAVMNTSYGVNEFHDRMLANSSGTGESLTSATCRSGETTQESPQTTMKPSTRGMPS